MPAAAATLEWSEAEPQLNVGTGEELDQALDRLAAGCSPERPSIVAVYVHGYQVMLGLGHPNSFVQLQQWSDSDAQLPLVTVGDLRADGEVTFYYLGTHHTEIPRRNLIPTSKARQIVRRFFDTGRRPNQAAWEPV